MWYTLLATCTTPSQKDTQVCIGMQMITYDATKIFISYCKLFVKQESLTTSYSYNCPEK